MATIMVTEESVLRLAGSRAFERGQRYHAEGRVRKLTVSGTTVGAEVDGERRYRIRLVVARSGLTGECTCPQGEEGMFCKHCVAAALAWLDDAGTPPESSAPDTELRSFLCGQSVAWLADELLRAAQADPLLRARLEVAAGADARDAYDDGELRERLARAIEIPEYIGYRDAYGYFLEIDEALDAVAELVGQGFADAAISLCEYALDLFEESAGMIDDSDGGLGAALSRVAEIHLDACAAGSPDPVALAERLVRCALGSDHEVFLDAIPDYADVLGTAGLARYRELVEAAWDALPPKQPGRYGDGRFAVTFLMERLAEYEGGTDALLGVLAREVASAYDVLRIAERLVEDGRDDEALDWLRRGLTEFAPDARLRSLAADCHLRAGRRAEAMDLLWANFVGRPTPEGYQALHAAAGEVWPDWRERALGVLRAEPTAAPRPSPNVSWAGHSTLVEVLLWEGDSDAAWEAANAGGCHRELMLRVARLRAETHPADALPILRQEAEFAVEQKNRSAYHHAARLLAESLTLAGRCGRDEDFRTYLAGLRATHRAKRALQDELNRARLP